MPAENGSVTPSAAAVAMAASAALPPAFRMSYTSGVLYPPPVGVIRCYRPTSTETADDPTALTRGRGYCRRSATNDRGLPVRRSFTAVTLGLLVVVTAGCSAATTAATAPGSNTSVTAPAPASVRQVDPAAFAAEI